MLLGGLASAQVNEPDRLMQAFTDRAMADKVARMATDERIKMYQTLVNYKPSDFHYQNLLAGAFIQKMRETMDPGYLDRASRIVDAVLSADGADYEALRLRSQIELERHNFTKVAEYSRELIASSPEDPWNWGTLGDSLMELGQYDKAAEAYQRMVNMRPDLSSYNRASYYRFVAGDAAGAIEVMKRAIGAGSQSMENVAWCYVDLGNMYFKTGQVSEAGRAYLSALRPFQAITRRMRDWGAHTPRRAKYRKLSKAINGRRPLCRWSNMRAPCRICTRSLASPMKRASRPKWST
jgi:tetratricopeptide (TPR) repeat protein